ncbi:hydroxymethylbilane synthase [Thalassoroseus pseudoceratinae]|uniref:hydroxymethylbilane synthase n=1 Tax=Thalassoroseus pseudoceratinae TaxID=2713176 RepID=UPI0014220A41|nr:hydroxymethylbilane synthase [Thalassoroseus pseudoceratinae]
MTTARTFRIATRSSDLALWQANHVADLLRSACPQHEVELIHVSTIGDRDRQAALHQMGGQGVFTREVQRVVLDNDADLAVHSLKDLPTVPVPGLVLAGVPDRADVFDALVLPANAESSMNWESLPPGSRIGTGSLRRQAQLLHSRTDIEFVPVRGNVPTRVNKVDDGEFDGIILAVAGLTRLGLADRVSQVLRPPLMYPAVGQGALGLECRDDDVELREVLQEISNRNVYAAVTAERVVLSELEAGCHAPVGTWTQFTEGAMKLDAVVLSADGQTKIDATATGSLEAPTELGREIAAILRKKGAQPLMNESATD